MEERVYVIPLRSGAKKAARNKRAGKAVNIIRDFLMRHAGTERVNVSQKINQALWSSSRQRPPKSIQVRVRVEDGTAVAKAMDEMFIEKAKEESKGKLEQLRDKVTSRPGIPDKPPEKKEVKKEDKKVKAPEKEPLPEQKPKNVPVKEHKDEKTENPSK